MHVFKKTFKNARANTHASSSTIFNLKIKTVIFFSGNYIYVGSNKILTGAFNNISRMF